MELAEIKKYCKDYKNILKSNRMSIGITPHSKLKVVEDAWEKLPETHKSPWIGCYAGYLMNRNTKIKEENLEYFVAYPAMPKWFPEVVEDFNKFFDHIKIEIVRYFL